jgi:hypothetical protein
MEPTWNALPAKRRSKQQRLQLPAKSDDSCPAACNLQAPRTEAQEHFPNTQPFPPAPALEFVTQSS